MNFNPKLWGKQFWSFIYFVALSKKETNKDEVKKFIENLKYVLPCDVCKIHFTKYVEKYPLNDDVMMGNNLLLWINRLENEINKGNKTLDESLSYHIREFKCKDISILDFLKNKNIIVSLLIIILIILIIVRIKLKK